MKKWYEIKARSDTDAEILIYDDIGLFGITAKDFINDLRAIEGIENLTVRINSYGGEIFDAFAIYNVLARHPATVTVIIDGIAASAASVIAMAGDKVVMPENAFLMIHRAWGVVIGNSEDMREWADTMAKFDTAIVNTYLKKSDATPEEIEVLMRDETWLTAKEAYELGFADEVSDPVKIAARASLRKFAKLPKELAETEIDEDEERKEEAGTAASNDHDELNQAAAAPDTGAVIAEFTAEDVEIARAFGFADAKGILSLCAKAGVPEAAAEWLDKGLKVEEIRDRLADADKIRARCAAAFPHDKERAAARANKYIKAGYSAAEAGADLFEVLLARDPHPIDNHLGPEPSRATKNKIDTAEILANYPMKKKK